MSNELFSVSIHDKDGASYVPATATLAEGIIDGMMEAQSKRGQISWEAITPAYAQGRVVATGERVVVAHSDLPMKIEDEVVTGYLFPAA